MKKIGQSCNSLNRYSTFSAIITKIACLKRRGIRQKFKTAEILPTKKILYLFKCGTGNILRLEWNSKKQESIRKRWPRNKKKISIFLSYVTETSHPSLLADSARVVLVFEISLETSRRIKSSNFLYRVQYLGLNSSTLFAKRSISVIYFDKILFSPTTLPILFLAFTMLSCFSLAKLWLY